ncbi:MAG: membrane or secreted protein [Cytophagia bacterium]|nr:membrane or secreted protein [Cytophagia bacterium]
MEVIRKKRIVVLCMLLLGLGLLSHAQEKRDAYVDSKGVMRWGHNKEEVKGFGVNYSVPFAHAYRSAERMELDVKSEIDKDVYQLTRLGFDLFRTHVWDTEISDTLGNLLTNEHLDAFDYLIYRLKENNFNFMLTPIAFWGNGWPEPDEDTPGFSNKYGKGNSLTNEGAIKAGQNYLQQFLNHVNPYTGLAYKNEPNLIAIEISNEPHHGGDADAVAAYVKGMVDAVKATGFKKPVFYNISHSVHFAEAYFKGGIDGGTFQWYPTNLTYQKELTGNLLPNVNDYNIPFDDVIQKNKGVKIVYEFDAADVGRSYIYPALTRSFREAGMQIATHFAYDPNFLAPYNTEYNTHYMNLSYTPAKAISLMISSEVFHHIPMNSDYGTYPENTSFGDFTVDYTNDLATFNNGSKFYYTNNTEMKPKNASTLEHVAGTANSPIIKYDGTGAYFLDKVSEGVWRLEVMPDAVWVDNPFGRNSPQRTLAVVDWNVRNMSVNLSDLGSGFSLEAINDGNKFMPNAEGNKFTIWPGTYIITKEGVNKNWERGDKLGIGAIRLGDFYAPESDVEIAWFNHEPVSEISSNEPVSITAQLVAPEEVVSVQLLTAGGFRRQSPIEMEQDGYTFYATVPADRLFEGAFNYHFLVEYPNEKFVTYPSGKEGRPFDWDFYDNRPYSVRVVNPERPISLFEASIDGPEVHMSQWSRGTRVAPTDNPMESEYLFNVQPFIEGDERPGSNSIYDVSLKQEILDKIEGRQADLSSKKEIVLRGNALNNKPVEVQVALTMDNGASFGKTIQVKPEFGEYTIDLSELVAVKTVTLPRPYPGFLPYYFEHNNQDAFDISRIENVQISIGPGLSESELKQSNGLAIRSIRLR